MACPCRGAQGEQTQRDVHCRVSPLQFPRCVTPRDVRVSAVAARGAAHQALEQHPPDARTPPLLRPGTSDNMFTALDAGDEEQEEEEEEVEEEMRSRRTRRRRIRRRRMRRG